MAARNKSAIITAAGRVTRPAKLIPAVTAATQAANFQQKTYPHRLSRTYIDRAWFGRGRLRETFRRWSDLIGPISGKPDIGGAAPAGGFVPRSREARESDRGAL